MKTKHPTIQAGETIGHIRVIRHAGYVRGHRTGYLCVCLVCGRESKMEAFQIRECAGRQCRFDPNAKPKKKRATTPKDASLKAVKPRPGKQKSAPPEREPTRDTPVTSRTLALYRKTTGRVREIVDEMVRVRVRVMREHKLALDMDRLYIESIEIAKIEAASPSPEPERYEPFWAYGVYQSPKGA